MSKKRKDNVGIFSAKQPGLLMNSDMKTPKGKAIYWLFFAFIIAVCLVTVVPAAWMILTSFKSTQEIYSSTSFFPAEFSLGGAWEHIVTSWKLLNLGPSMINTIIVSLGNAFVAIFVCGLGGYVLSKLRVTGTRFVFILVIWTMMMPGSVRTVPTFMSFTTFPFVWDNGLDLPTNINILNTYLPMWIGAAANSFTIILFKNNFDAIPNALIESAKLDGCNNFQVFYKIVLPVALPVVIYVLIGALSSAWGDYLSSVLYLGDPDMWTTPARIYSLQDEPTIKANVYMMGLLFSSMPPLIIFCIFQKYIMGGVTMGSVKG